MKKEKTFSSIPTEATVLPVYHRMLEEKKGVGKGFYALYILPLRALNRDMSSRLG
ncbi:Lhr-like helicase [Methanophagales archaeon]|nr:Lhr-like helicase [Methanophagales archaeon]